VFPVDRVAAWLAERDIELIEPADEEIRHRVAGADTGEGDAARLRELGIQREDDFVYFVAPLESVAAANPAH
jgi:hypothetical protein